LVLRRTLFFLGGLSNVTGSGARSAGDNALRVQLPVAEWFREKSDPFGFHTANTHGNAAVPVRKAIGIEILFAAISHWKWSPLKSGAVTSSTGNGDHLAFFVFKAINLIENSVVQILKNVQKDRPREQRLRDCRS
jgi:hypothetical protein